MIFEHLHNDYLRIENTILGILPSRYSYANPPGTGEDEDPPKTTKTSKTKGGGKGKGKGSGASDKEKDAAKNLGAITGANIRNNNQLKKSNLEAIKIANKQNKNNYLTQNANATMKAGMDWSKQQKLLQSSMAGLTDQAGQSMRGSFAYDVWDALATADDNIDTDTLNQLWENKNNNQASYFEAAADNNNKANQLRIDTWKANRDQLSDYAAQINNINPALGTGSKYKVSGDAESIGNKAGKGKAEYGKLFQTGKHNLNAPNWMDKLMGVSKKNKKGLPKLSQAKSRAKIPLSRSAADNASAFALAQGRPNTGSATSQDYWARLRAGYNAR
jgi:hypothetical protein